MSSDEEKTNQQYASLRVKEENIDAMTIVTPGAFTEQAAGIAPDLDVVHQRSGLAVGVRGGQA